MKKITNLITLGIAVFSLAACAAGNKVSEEKFKEEVNNLPEASYTSATLTIDSLEKIEGLGSEYDTEEKVKGTFTYTYDADKKTWVAQEEDGKQFASDIFNIKSAGLDGLTYNGTDSEMAAAYKVSYYVNPLKVELTVDYKATSETLGVTISASIKGSASMSFDKYGYVTKCSSNMVMNDSTSGEYMGVKVDESMTVTSKVNYTVSYK